MAELSVLREAVTAALVSAGIEAMDARPERERTRVDAPVAAVELKSAQSEGAGFCDYLGERETAGGIRELYGRRLRAVFALELYSPRDARYGAAGCRALFDEIAGALAQGLPSGLRLKKLSCGPVSFDRTLGLYHCTAEAECLAYLCAQADESGLLLDFVLRGVIAT